MSPPQPCVSACMIKSVPSRMVIEKRVIVGSVIGNTPVVRRRRKRGATELRLLRMFA